MRPCQCNARAENLCAEGRRHRPERLRVVAYLDRFRQSLQHQPGPQALRHPHEPTWAPDGTGTGVAESGAVSRAIAFAPTEPFLRVAYSSRIVETIVASVL